MAYNFYCLQLKLEQGQEIEVGKKGQVFFPPGYYFYAGQARRGIRKRLARHLAGPPKKHWHIDYLSCQALPVGMQLYTEDEGSECDLARALDEAGGQIILPGFGSSDCNCPSHLYFFPRARSIPSLK